jgi:hypothetical protein
MTTDIFLDPEQVNELEPFEGDERNKVMLSPFAIPRSVVVEFLDRDSLSLIRFRYSGGETAAAAEPLDTRTDPVVTVRTSLPTEKVLELAFSPPAKASDLKAVSERLEARARGIPSNAKRLSYRLTASILAAEWLVGVIW